MTTERLESFYKYCPVGTNLNAITSSKCIDDLKACNEYSLANLFSHHAKFATRHDFNDLFDTQIRFKIPDARERKNLLRKMSNADRRLNSPLFKGAAGERNFAKYARNIEKLFDQYIFYCVSATPSSNLMWSHYSNSHHGYCIEWDSKYINAEKVSYEDKLPTFPFLEIVKIDFGLSNSQQAGELLWEAMKIKQKEWSYEKEYRYQPSLETCNKAIVTKTENFSILRYEPHWVKSIIFGARMDNKVKEFIVDKYQNEVDFKVAVPCMLSGQLRIETYNG